jgi:hypothetical protein
VKLDFIIPASPNDAFFSQLAMFRLGLDALGGPYRDARLVAVFGADERSALPLIWRPRFERIEVEWAEPEAFKRDSYRAQGDRRFEVMRPDADVVVLCDADTLLIRPFSEDVLEVVRNDAIGGVIAHYHFPWAETSGDSAVDWNALSRRVLGAPIATPFQYTLLNPTLPGACPFYINLGFLVGSPESLLSLHESCQEIRSQVRGILQNVFDAQVTLALASAAKGLKTAALPMQYNFPNDPIADTAYPADMDEIRLIHYLRTEHFDRHYIFSDRRSFDHFLSLKLSGSNLLFQQHVLHLTGGNYPFTTNRSDDPKIGER